MIADGMHIAFAAKHMGTMRNPHLPYRVDRPTYRFDGVGYIDEALQDIFAVQLDTGDVQQITDENCVCSAPRWSPDSKHILYSVSLLPDTQRNIWPGLRVINVNSGRTTTIVGPEGRATAAVWLPDGQRIAYTGLPDYGTIAFASNDELWIAVFDGEQGITAARKVARLGWTMASGVAYSRICQCGIYSPPHQNHTDSQFAYVNVQIGGTLHVYRVALNGPELATHCTGSIAQ